MKLLIANGYIIDPAQQVNTGGRSLLSKTAVLSGCSTAAKRFRNRPTSSTPPD